MINQQNPFGQISASLLSQVIKVLISIGTMIVLAHNVAPEIFGVFASYLAIHAILFTLVDFGLTPVFVKSDSYGALEKSVFTTLSLLLTVVYILVFYISVSILGLPIENDVIITFIISTLLSAFNLPLLAELIREKRQDVLLRINVTAVLISSFMAILVSYSSEKLLALQLQFLVVPFIQFLYFILIRKEKIILSSIKSLMDFREEILFAVKIFATRLVNSIAYSYDKLLVERYFGLVALGNYSRSFQIVRYSDASFVTSMSSPILAILARFGILRSRTKYIDFLKLIQLVTLNFLVFIVVFRFELIGAILGEEWLLAAEYLPGLAMWAFGKVLQSCHILFLTNEKQVTYALKHSSINIFLGFLIFLIASSSQLANLLIFWGGFNLIYWLLVISSFMIRLLGKKRCQKLLIWTGKNVVLSFGLFLSLYFSFSFGELFSVLLIVTIIYFIFSKNLIQSIINDTR